MYVAEYSYSESYFHFEVADVLPEEGLLKGEKGQIWFKRVQDGLAVYDSTLPNTGFMYPGSPDDIYVPHTINHIPVTELHQSLLPKSYLSVGIENGNLKRVFLEISRRSINKKMEETQDPAKIFALYLIYAGKDSVERKFPTEIEISFAGTPINQVDFCSIICDDQMLLHIPPAKVVKVAAGRTELRGGVPDCVEQLAFSGKVYPFLESGWDLDEPNNRCFENLKNLRIIEGSLSGDICWSFCNCTALERIHLSNGITSVPADAFRNCRSLKDLYIPDTVLVIGAYAFSGCTNLTSIHLPPNLKKISEGMFNGCKSLKKVFLSDTIETIEDYAFAGCTSLRKPWIPKNIHQIAETAFSVSEH